MSVIDELRAFFPTMDEGICEVTSNQTVAYNCVAWAAEVDHQWWWPDSLEVSYWPETIVRRGTVDAFVDAFATLGYMKCSSGDVDVRFQKVAIFANADGRPLHMARQLRNGKWTSKLGEAEDMCHVLSVLEGSQYGSVVCYLAREWR